MLATTKKYNSIQAKISMQRKYQNVGEDPSMKTAVEIESGSTNCIKKWCLHREKIPFKTKGFF